jgi:isoaspartyl peptidase/L-asparaginase-like protein (Ntn-hydrolase superfamily)
MKNRRRFLKCSALTATAVLGQMGCATQSDQVTVEPITPTPGSAPAAQPVVVSTWKSGLAANEAAWEILRGGGAALDAVEAGVRVTESDAKNRSVGLGGNPDRDGHVTLDACIMNHKSQCGSVAFLQHIEHPISVARKVMEETPHVMLVGAGALKFAKQQGFKTRNLLTQAAKDAWEKWKIKSDYKSPEINVENHDTIGMLALDAHGNLSGSCTTSGAGYKLHGRVGDSPIIGSGLFVDNEVGAACATGLGEAVIRVAGCSLVVELMRQGHSPQEACRLAVQRVIEKHDDPASMQVAFLALNKQGQAGGFAIRDGFNYARFTGDGNGMIDAGNAL